MLFSDSPLVLSLLVGLWLSFALLVFVGSAVGPGRAPLHRWVLLAVFSLNVGLLVTVGFVGIAWLMLARPEVAAPVALLLVLGFAAHVHLRRLGLPLSFLLAWGLRRGR